MKNLIRRILKEETFNLEPKLLSQMIKKGRGPKSHYEQVSKDKEGNDVPDGEGMNNWQSRNAYDLMASPGTKVSSPVNGKVIDSYKSSTTSPYVYGWNVIIKTDNGDEIFMTHLDPNKYKAVKGDVIKKGDLIGYIGDPSSESKTFKPHLHVSTKNESGDIFSYIGNDLGIKFTEDEKESYLNRYFPLEKSSSISMKPIEPSVIKFKNIDLNKNIKEIIDSYRGKKRSEIKNDIRKYESEKERYIKVGQYEYISRIVDGLNDLLNEI